MTNDTHHHRPWRDRLHDRHKDTDLARGSLNPFEVFGQSIGAAGPSIAIAGTLPFVFFTAGSASFLSVIVGTVIVLLVAVVVAQFARVHASTGSLYSYAAEGLGPWAGFIGGWGLTLGYTGIASACAAGVALFTGAFLTEIGIAAGGTAVLLTLLVAAVVLAVWVTIRGVKVSTRTTVLLELASLVAIFAVFIAALIHFGFSVNSQAASDVAPANLSTVVLGAVIAVTCFVGFESAGSLGVEANNPHRAIPRAIYTTAIIAGSLYLVASLIQLIAFSNGVDATSAFTPFNAIADATGATWLSPLVDLGVAISAFACTVASITGASRSLFNLSREGALPTPLGHAHRAFRTPHVAIVVVAAVALIVPLLYVVLGQADANTQLWASYLATAVGGTYGYLLAYLLVAISALVHFGRQGTLRFHVAAAAVLVIVSLGYVAWTTFGQYDRVLPYGFTILLAIGVLWYALVWFRDRDRARQVGTFTLSVENVQATPPQEQPSTVDEVDSPLVR